jgi:hypothetical protein
MAGLALSIGGSAVIALVVGVFGFGAGAMLNNRIVRRRELDRQDARAEQLRGWYVRFLIAAGQLYDRTAASSSADSSDALQALRHAFAPLEIAAPAPVLAISDRVMTGADRVAELATQRPSAGAALNDARTELLAAVDELRPAMRADLAASAGSQPLA